jgi:hypothetical protein
VSGVGLRLEQAPPFSVPLRFFLTAPLFGAIAAGVMLVSGPEILVSRWQPALLAVTHFYTLGVLTMVMLGALMQMLPVLAGSPVRRPRAVAAVVHVLLVVGTFALAASFPFSYAGLRAVALGALGAGLGVFVVASGASVARAAANASITAMRLALVGLIAVTLLGLYIASSWARNHMGFTPALTDVHLGWGLIGWVALLIIGVAYQVVPMFQLTRAYPAWLRAVLVPAAFVALVLWSGATAIDSIPAWLAQASAAMLAAALVLYALATLWLQVTRQRRLPDAAVRFWMLAMLSLLACVALWSVRAVGFVADPRLDLLIGAWMILGFAGSTIIGMLYKIVPFLAWLHLQARGSAPPNMREFLPDAYALAHGWLHALALALIALAIFVPSPWLYPAAVALLASFLWLGWNLTAAVWRYRRAAAAARV